MKLFFKKVRESIIGYFSARRYVWMSIYEKEIVLVGYVYYPSSHAWRRSWKISLEGISENNIASSKRLSCIFAVAFFPFPYRVAIVSSHKHCAAMYSHLSFPRERPRTILNEEEVVGFFSNALLKTLDTQKKIISEKSDFDDLNALLVNHHITSSSIGQAWHVFDPDGVFGATGSRLSFGMTHTFAYRPLVSGVVKLLPRRARLAHVFERGFSLPLWLLLTSVSQAPTRATKQFVYASVLESETDIFVFDGSRLAFVDSFTFGSRTLYDALNESMGIDRESFSAFLEMFTLGQLSAHVRSYAQTIIDAELQRLTHGISSFKKSFGATTVYVNGGDISALLAHHSKYSSSHIGSFCENERIPHFSDLLDEAHKADLSYVSSIPRRSKMHSLSLKLIRWLIPYDINTMS